MNRNVYSVGQINQYIKRMFSEDYLLGNVSVKGEISNCKYHTSGHIYFTLKDETGAISGVMFRGKRAGLKFQMKEGDKVVVTGSVEVFERSGAYQIYADSIELQGAGDLYQKLEALKKELSEMGMFDPMYKKPIPKYARTVGIVTARTGAAIQDIRNIATRRNPAVQLILYPALVQGPGAAETIVQGIRALDQYGVDVIIIGRGGGSIEDLWAFNEEIVARAVFDCNTPIVSAVGHEVDWTIADLVADHRAPTPSAAAEICVFDRNQAREDIKNCTGRMSLLFSRQIKFARTRLESAEKRLAYLSPQNKLKENRRQLADLEVRLYDALSGKLSDRRTRLMLLAGRLEGNSPLKKLESGFGYLENKDGKKINTVEELGVGEPLSVYLKDGKVKASVTEVIKRS